MTSEDKIVVGSKVTIAQDAEIKGHVTFGTETVVHPKASVLAIGGPIIIGSGCIIEEDALIVNRRQATMRIGDYNYFEVGSRVEAASVGSHNVFEVRSFVAADVAVESFCTVGAGCSLLGNSLWPVDPEDVFKDELPQEDQEQESEDGGAAKHQGHGQPAETERFEVIPDKTVVYGHDSKRRLWSGEGVKQQAALHAKHLDYLRDQIPKGMKLKLIN